MADNSFINKRFYERFKKRATIAILLTLIISLPTVFFAGYYAARGNPGSTIVFEHPASEANYLVWKEGSTYYAKSGPEGTIDYTGTDVNVLINSVFNGLTPGRTWMEKVVLQGEFTGIATILPKSYTTVEIQGKLQLKSTATEIYGIYVLGQTHVEITGGIIEEHPDNTVYNVFVYFKDSEACRLSNVKLLNCYHEAVQFQDSTDCEMTHCYSENSRCCMAFVATGCKRIAITDNICNGTWTTEGITIGGDAVPCQEILVANNIIYNTKTEGILIYKGSKNVVVSGNVLLASSQSADRATIAVQDNCEAVVISGNTLKGGLGTGIKVQNGCNFTIVSNNVIEENQLDGIAISGSSRVTVSGNQIINVGQASDNSYDGIVLEKYYEIFCEDNVITNNQIISAVGVANRIRWAFIDEATHSAGAKTNTFSYNSMEGTFGSGYILRYSSSRLITRNNYPTNRGTSDNPWGLAFDYTNDVIQTFYNANADPEASTDYVVIGNDIIMTATSQTGGAVLIKAPGGTTITNFGVAGFNHTFIQIGWMVNFGAFTVAPYSIVIQPL